jgi:1,4-dihydroxy-2-naphthoyl-CoA hydrolase
VRAFAEAPHDMAKRSSFRPEVTAEELNKRSRGHLPGLVGMEIVEVAEGRLRGRLPLRPDLLAPNGFLHAAAVIALADTLCGYGCVAHLPEGAKGFTTIELKSNFLGTLLEGALACEATPVHLGRNTQVWDAVVADEAKGRRLALFRCTQIVLW